MDNTGNMPRPAVDYGSGYDACGDTTYGEWHVHVDSRDDVVMVRARRNCQYASIDREGRDVAKSWTLRRWLLNPTSERAVRRAVAACWKWCDRRNAREARADRLEAIARAE